MSISFMLSVCSGIKETDKRRVALITTKTEIYARVRKTVVKTINSKLNLSEKITKKFLFFLFYKYQFFLLR